MFSDSDPPPPSINVIDADADWIDPLAFPEQDIAETLPLEHDGLDLTEISEQQRIDFVKERRLALIPGSNYILIKYVVYNIKRPFIHAPEIPRLLLPQQFRNQVIDRAHKEVGHLSYATVTRIAEAYVWPLMRQAVRNRIAKCPTCCVHSRRTDKVAPGEVLYATGPMSLLGMDLIGPLPLSNNGNRYILTIIDHSSLWAEAYPLPDKTNKSVWTAFANHYLPRFACPNCVISDNGAEFSGKDWEQYLLDLGIQLHKTTPYHPQSNGRTENFNKNLKGLLCKACNNDVHAWEDRLGDVLWAYRISVSSVTHFSPYFLQYGRLPRVPLSKTLPVRSADFFGNRLDNLATALQQARVNMQNSRNADRTRLLARADAQSLQVGDYCLLLANERVTLSSRFDPLWLITRLRGSTVWLHQQSTGQIRKVHRSKVRLADATLAWDEITVRPRRKQAPRTRVRTRVLGDDEIVLRDNKQTRANKSRSSTEPCVLPPIRLRRQLIDNTDKNGREGHARTAASDKHCDGSNNEMNDDRMSVTHSVRPIKRSMHTSPSAVACKKARWEVIALVREFT